MEVRVIVSSQRVSNGPWRQPAGGISILQRWQRKQAYTLERSGTAGLGGLDAVLVGLVTLVVICVTAECCQRLSKLPCERTRALLRLGHGE